MTRQIGHVLGGSPWTKAAIENFAHRFPETFGTIESALPEGCWITILAANGKYGSWVAVLVNGSGEIVRSAPRNTLTAACYAALEAGRAVAV